MVKHLFENGQLLIVGQGLPEIPLLLAEKYGSIVKRLDLSYNSISTLKNLEKFLHLEELILDNNSLTSPLTFPKLPKLHTLWMNKNQIRDVGACFEKKLVVKNLPSLNYVSLLNNPGCPNELTQKDPNDYKRYRYLLLYRIPKLVFLDAAKVTPKERKEGKRVGHLMVVARPAAAPAAASSPTTEKDPGYQPLPQEVSEGGTRGAVFGLSEYIYYGKNSEGNRFILNHDL